jgi:hypothetical protein
VSLPYHRTGNAKPWRFDTRPQDASLRYKWHGPIVPLDPPGFFAKLFGRG